MAVLTVDELRTKYNFSIPESARATYENYLETATEACMKVIGLTSSGTADFVDYFDSDIVNFVLYSAPVTEVTGVDCWDGSEWASQSLDAAVIQLPSGIVTFRNPLPCNGNKTVRVKYKAGYVEWPADLKMCVAMTTQHLAKQMQSNMVGVNSRSVDGGTEALDGNLPPLSVLAHLMRYKIGRAR